MTLGLFNFGTINAQWGYICSHEYPEQNHTQRSELGIMVAESFLIPPIELISSALISNFWQHGRTLSSKVFLNTQ